MPPGGAGNQKGRKQVKAEPPASAQLGEHERVLEVRLRATITDPVALRDEAGCPLVHCRFFQEDKVLRLGDALTVREEETTTVRSKPGRQAPVTPEVVAGDVDVVISQQRIVLDLATLSKLLASSEGADTDRVTVHGPPPPPPPTPPAADGLEEAAQPVGPAGSGRGKGKRGTPAKEPPPANKASTPQSKPKPKGKGRSATPQLGRDDLTGDCLCVLPLSFIDVMHTAEREYAVEAPLPGVENCRVVLRCRDNVLAPPALLRQFRPVIFAVHAVDNIPTPATGADRRGPTAVRVAIEALGLRAVSPPLLDTSGHGTPYLFRTARLLGDAPLLEVYQRALLEPAVVTVRHCDSTGAVDGAVIGTGTFSLHDAATDRQTLFDETLSLLPVGRLGVATDSCLAADTTVTCSMDFIVPLPRLMHVLEDGSRAPKRAVMTRGVAVLPYAAPWMPAAVACLLEQLMASRRATKESDVRLYVEEPEPPSAAQMPETPVTELSMSSGAAHRSPGKGRHDRRESGQSSPKKVSTAATSIAGGADGVAEEPPAPSWPFDVDAVRVVSPAGISGFEIADEERRVVCVEGPAGEVHRILSALLQTVSAATAGDAEAAGFRLSMNSELFAARRLYVDYPPLVTPPKGCTLKGTAEEAEEPHQGGEGGEEEGEEGEEGVEVDEMGGGCGGRIHRIRLREPISALMRQQRFLLRRSLAPACLECLLQLDGLAACCTLRDAVLRSLFPSAAGVVSLERSFGQTLELHDIFGTAEPPSAVPGEKERSGGVSGAGSATTWPAGASRSSAAPTATAATSTVDGDADAAAAAFHVAAAMDPANPHGPGSLVSFEGRVKTGRLRPIPPAVTARHPRALWMEAVDGTEVLCVFGGDAPGGTIRYRVEGQVLQVGVEADGPRVLYVLDYHTLAKSFTDSRNAAFDRHLAARRREERLAGMASRRIGGAGGRWPGDGGSSRTAGTSTTGIAATAASRHGDSDSEGDDDAASPPVVDDLSGSGPAADGFGAPFSSRSRKRVGTTKTSAMRAVLAAERRPPEPDYAQLWDLYDKRAPKGSA